MNDDMLSNEEIADAADEALHSLFEANRILRDAGERVAVAAGQTHARRMVLQVAGQGATVPDIARSLGLQRQGVQRITDELVAEGLGKYEDNPRHRRSKLFIVTDAGQTTLSEIRCKHARWLSEVRANASEMDWSLLRRELDYLVASLRGSTEADEPLT